MPETIQKNDKLIELLSQIQDTFTDEISRNQIAHKGNHEVNTNGLLAEGVPANMAMMNNLIPQTTATLEQQLLQCTAPGAMKLGPKFNHNNNNGS